MNNPNTNQPSVDYAQQEIERLGQDYPGVPKEAAEIMALADAIPDEIADDDMKAEVAALIKRHRDFVKHVNGIHEIEKQPHLRRGQGTDQFFFGIIGCLLKRNRSDRPGTGDALSAKLTRYDQRKLAEEQERRREEARKAQAEADRLERERVERERIEREAREAAERARKPETKEEKTAVAEQAAQEASAARVEEQIAEADAHKAHIDTLAKPADIMRNRGAGGVMTTMAQESYAEVVDRTKLDKEALWPFIGMAAIEQALRAYAKTTGYTQPMEGAAIGKRAKSVVR